MTITKEDYTDIKIYGTLDELDEIRCLEDKFPYFDKGYDFKNKYREWNLDWSFKGNKEDLEKIRIFNILSNY